MSDLTVYQPSHSRYTLGVTTTMMAVCLPQALIPPHSKDCVLHHYAALGKGCVVGYVLRRTLFVLPSRSVLVRPTRFATRIEAQSLRVEGSYAYIR